MYNGDDVDVTAEVTRCLAGRLHNAYPVGAHDVEIGVDGAGSAASLATVLQCLSAAISVAEPNCRRIIYAVSAGQSRDSALGERDVLRAAQTAGFRYVIDVETGDGEELKLCVVEPDWVTRADIDLDRVPNS
ncbi:hypothetical protein BA059_27295 [Mycolicibacterium sp. (ex Dasyatis americana)]|nr:hypothetical protein BA059_27295 [Mycolicibacterium sp. (ex Dasyatis americana)]